MVNLRAQDPSQSFAHSSLRLSVPDLLKSIGKARRLEESVSEIVRKAYSEVGLNPRMSYHLETKSSIEKEYGTLFMPRRSSMPLFAEAIGDPEQRIVSVQVDERFKPTGESGILSFTQTYHLDLRKMVMVGSSIVGNAIGVMITCYGRNSPENSFEAASRHEAVPKLAAAQELVAVRFGLEKILVADGASDRMASLMGIHGHELPPPTRTHLQSIGYVKGDGGYWIRPVSAPPQLKT